MMKLVFWVSFALVGYAYLGYPLLLFIIGQLRGWRPPIARQSATPSVSILIAARNEAASLPAKLDNLRTLAYPPHLIQVIVVSDGSTDSTAAILAQAVPEVFPVVLGASVGKALALNEGVQYATGEILVFLDARQSLDGNAVAELVSCFADPEIGAVSGELLLESALASAHGGATTSGPGEALGLYWKIEKAVRRLESASGSVIGVTGAIYAMRRELYTPMPRGLILDDVFIPMHVVRAGKRVIFQPLAIARDRVFSEPGREFARKVRTLTGNYQLVRLAPWLLSAANPALFRFISHKLARLLVPLLLVFMLAGSALAGGRLYGLLAWLQALFYFAGALGLRVLPIRRLKLVAIASTFVMLNAAAVLAFVNFAKRREQVWR